MNNSEVGARAQLNSGKKHLNHQNRKLDKSYRSTQIKPPIDENLTIL